MGGYGDERNARDGLEGNLEFPEERVDAALHDGDEDDDGEGVEVEEEIVREAMEFHWRKR